jgi:hypothetical protein
MYVCTLTFMGRNPDFRRCRNVVVLLSGVKRVTHCHLLLNVSVLGERSAHFWKGIFTKCLEINNTK